MATPDWPAWAPGLGLPAVHGRQGPGCVWVCSAEHPGPAECMDAWSAPPFPDGGRARRVCAEWKPWDVPADYTVSGQGRRGAGKPRVTTPQAAVFLGFDDAHAGAMVFHLHLLLKPCRFR